MYHKSEKHEISKKHYMRQESEKPNISRKKSFEGVEKAT